MDYVLFGMGYGATLMLLGWALRTWGPALKYNSIDIEDTEVQAEQQGWVRFVLGLGGVLSVIGVAMVLFTFVIMLVNPDDDTGAFISLVIWGFLLVALLVWFWFFFSNYGTNGVWTKEKGYGFRSQPTSLESRYPEPTLSTTRLVTPARATTSATDLETTEIDDSEHAADSDDPLDDALTADTGVEEMSAAAEADGFEDANTDDELDAEAEADAIEVDATVESEEYDSDSDQDESGNLDSDTDSAAEGHPEEATPGTEYDFGDGSDTTVTPENIGRTEALRRIQERRARAQRANSTETEPK